MTGNTKSLAPCLLCLIAGGILIGAYIFRGPGTTCRPMTQEEAVSAVGGVGPSCVTSGVTCSLKSYTSNCGVACSNSHYYDNPRDYHTNVFCIRCPYQPPPDDCNASTTNCATVTKYDCYLHYDIYLMTYICDPRPGSAVSIGKSHNSTGTNCVSGC